MALAAARRSLPQYWRSLQRPIQSRSRGTGAEAEAVPLRPRVPSVRTSGGRGPTAGVDQRVPVPAGPRSSGETHVGEHSLEDRGKAVASSHPTHPKAPPHSAAPPEAASAAPLPLARNLSPISSTQ